MRAIMLYSHFHNRPERQPTQGDSWEERLRAQLPDAVAKKVAQVWRTSSGRHHFVVGFRGGRQIEFPYTPAMEFPTEADLVRICLEAP